MTSHSYPVWSKGWGQGIRSRTPANVMTDHPPPTGRSMTDQRQTARAEPRMTALAVSMNSVQNPAQAKERKLSLQTMKFDAHFPSARAVVSCSGSARQIVSSSSPKSCMQGLDTPRQTCHHHARSGAAESHHSGTRGKYKPLHGQASITGANVRLLAG